MSKSTLVNSRTGSHEEKKEEFTQRKKRFTQRKKNGSHKEKKGFTQSVKRIPPDTAIHEQMAT